MACVLCSSVHNPTDEDVIPKWLLRAFKVEDGPTIVSVRWYSTVHAGDLLHRLTPLSGRTADRRFPHYGCVSGCNGVKIAWNHEMSGARRGQSIGQGLLLFRTPAPAVHREGMCPRTAAGT